MSIGTQARYSGETRRRTRLRLGLLAVAIAYVGVLLLAPLIGIAWTVAKGGWHVVSTTVTAQAAGW